MKTGNTTLAAVPWDATYRPQWSPVMKTGNTGRFNHGSHQQDQASMEPGHEDREYKENTMYTPKHSFASMEPGHEDREYWP